MAEIAWTYAEALREPYQRFLRTRAGNAAHRLLLRGLARSEAVGALMSDPLLGDLFRRPERHEAVALAMGILDAVLSDPARAGPGTAPAAPPAVTS